MRPIVDGFEYVSSVRTLRRRAILLVARPGENASGTHVEDVRRGWQGRIQNQQGPISAL
jgi:hypothetical protein